MYQCAQQPFHKKSIFREIIGAKNFALVAPVVTAMQK
jgi:hypothetical protein